MAVGEESPQLLHIPIDEPRRGELRDQGGGVGQPREEPGILQFHPRDPVDESPRAPLRPRLDDQESARAGEPDLLRLFAHLVHDDASRRTDVDINP